MFCFAALLASLVAASSCFEPEPVVGAGLPADAASAAELGEIAVEYLVGSGGNLEDSVVLAVEASGWDCVLRDHSEPAIARASGPEVLAALAVEAPAGYDYSLATARAASQSGGSCSAAALDLKSVVDFAVIVAVELAGGLAVEPVAAHGPEQPELGREREPVAGLGAGLVVVGLVASVEAEVVDVGATLAESPDCFVVAPLAAGSCLDVLRAPCPCPCH